MRPIPLGAKGTYSLRVMPAHLANQFKDAALPQVFATPMMIRAMENAALNAVRDYLDPGESAVGTVVNIRHLAATPVGHQVIAQAEVTKVDGRRIEFNVSARDEMETSMSLPSDATCCPRFSVNWDSSKVRTNLANRSRSCFGRSSGTVIDMNCSRL